MAGSGPGGRAVAGISLGAVQPFDYDAWLEDHELPPDDEDFEWCCHIIVLAESKQAAHAWGDMLVKQLSAGSPDEFLRSSVEPHVCGLATAPGTKHPCPNYPALSRPGNEMLAMPVVTYGEPATGEFIGW
jgi:hypothetical protein